MVNQITKDRITLLHSEYCSLAVGAENALHEIALAEIPEAVYNSNAIENSTLTFEDTERILTTGIIPKNLDTREIYEAQNLAKVMQEIISNSQIPLTVQRILDLHKILLSNINDAFAGNFRKGTEWVRVGGHVGANPDFVNSFISELIAKYSNSENYFLDDIAHFHAEFETIHPFSDGNGRTGRALINLQLIGKGYPPIIIQNKTKKTDYYPLFQKYHSNFKTDIFTSLFAVLLQESLHKRIAILTSARLLTLSKWAKENGINANSAANKAKRQTIPAFRMRGKWMIPATYREK